MRIIIAMPMVCECGYMLYVNQEEEVFCQNVDCAQAGKKFKRPTVALEEIKP